MGEDYYKILQVNKNARDEELNQAFRKFANEKKEAEAKFKQISEAYEVLSDPRKRAVYDQYGVEGLKREGLAPNTDRSSYFTGSGRPNIRFNSQNADDFFSEFLFGSSSPHGGGGGGSSSSSPFGGGGGYMFPGHLQKAPPIQNSLPCSLEDLCNGTTKKMKIHRDIVDINGKTVKVEELLNIDVKPGWKKGTKITFPEKGNVKPNIIAPDLVFVIDEKPHSVFTRDGDDLIVTKTISVVEAFTGYTVSLTTLDGRNLTTQIDNVIHPGYEEVVPTEGMPIQKDPTKKGKLIIKFNINYPKKLTAEQKAGIRRALGTL